MDRGGIVVDIGVAYSKFGYVGDNAPQKIIKTPERIFSSFK